MLNVVANLTPQMAAPEASTQSGSNGSSDSSFADALNAATSNQDNGVLSDRSTNQPSDSSELTPKPDGQPSADATEMAGAAQVAVFTPVQQTPAQEPTVSAESVAVAQVSSSTVQPGQQSAQISQNTTAQMDLESAAPAATADSAAMVNQDGKQSADTAEADTLRPAQTPWELANAAQPVTEAKTQPTETQSAPVSEDNADVLTPMEKAMKKAAEAASTPQATAADAKATVVQASTQAATQVQSEVAPAQTKSTEKTDCKVNDPKAGQQVTTNPEGSPETKVPIETVPVQWRFDAPANTSRAVTGADASFYRDSLTNPTAKQTGEDTAMGTGAKDQQPVMPMGLQFSGQLREAQVTAAANNSDLHTRVIDQVVEQVKLSQIDGRSNIVVRLNPPDLGSLRLQISQDAAGMTTHIEAANSQVRGLLEAHMPALMDSLAKAGVQMDSVSVSVGTSFNAFAQNANQGNAQANYGQQRQQYHSGQTMAGGVAAIADAASPAWGASEHASHSWLA